MVVVCLHQVPEVDGIADTVQDINVYNLTAPPGVPIQL
jgi:hypothetical protein